MTWTTWSDALKHILELKQDLKQRKSLEGQAALAIFRTIRSEIKTFAPNLTLEQLFTTEILTLEQFLIDFPDVIDKLLNLSHDLVDPRTPPQILASWLYFKCLAYQQTTGNLVALINSAQITNDAKITEPFEDLKTIAEKIAEENPIRELSDTAIENIILSLAQPTKSIQRDELFNLDVALLRYKEDELSIFFQKIKSVFSKVFPQEPKEKISQIIYNVVLIIQRQPHRRSAAQQLLQVIVESVNAMQVAEVETIIGSLEQYFSENKITTQPIFNNLPLITLQNLYHHISVREKKLDREPDMILVAAMSLCAKYMHENPPFNQQILKSHQSSIKEIKDDMTRYSERSSSSTELRSIPPTILTISELCVVINDKINRRITEVQLINAKAIRIWNSLGQQTYESNWQVITDDMRDYPEIIDRLIELAKEAGANKSVFIAFIKKLITSYLSHLNTSNSYNETTRLCTLYLANLECFKKAVISLDVKDNDLVIALDKASQNIQEKLVQQASLFEVAIITSLNKSNKNSNFSMTASAFNQDFSQHNIEPNVNTNLLEESVKNSISICLSAQEIWQAYQFATHGQVIAQIDYLRQVYTLCISQLQLLRSAYIIAKSNSDRVATDTAFCLITLDYIKRFEEKTNIDQLLYPQKDKGKILYDVSSIILALCDRITKGFIGRDEDDDEDKSENDILLFSVLTQSILRNDNAFVYELLAYSFRQTSFTDINAIEKLLKLITYLIRFAIVPLFTEDTILDLTAKEKIVNYFDSIIQQLINPTFEKTINTDTAKLLQILLQYLNQWKNLTDEILNSQGSKYLSQKLESSIKKIGGVIQRHLYDPADVSDQEDDTSTDDSDSSDADDESNSFISDSFDSDDETDDSESEDEDTDEDDNSSAVKAHLENIVSDDFNPEPIITRLNNNQTKILNLLFKQIPNDKIPNFILAIKKNIRDKRNYQLACSIILNCINLAHSSCKTLLLTNLMELFDSDFKHNQEDLVKDLTQTSPASTISLLCYMMEHFNETSATKYFTLFYQKAIAPLASTQPDQFLIIIKDFLNQYHKRRKLAFDSTIFSTIIQDVLQLTTVNRDITVVKLCNILEDIRVIDNTQKELFQRLLQPLAENNLLPSLINIRYNSINQIEKLDNRKIQKFTFFLFNVLELVVVPNFKNYQLASKKSIVYSYSHIIENFIKKIKNSTLNDLTTELLNALASNVGTLKNLTDSITEDDLSYLSKTLQTSIDAILGLIDTNHQDISLFFLAGGILDDTYNNPFINAVSSPLDYLYNQPQRHTPPTHSRQTEHSQFNRRTLPGLMTTYYGGSNKNTGAKKPAPPAAGGEINSQRPAIEIEMQDLNDRKSDNDLDADSKNGKIKKRESIQMQSLK